jgi:Putative peptidoglycan binding domain
MPIQLSDSSRASLFRIAQCKVVLRNLVNEPFCTVFRPKVSETEHASREPYCPSNQAADPLLGRYPPRTEFPCRFLFAPAQRDAKLGLTPAFVVRPSRRHIPVNRPRGRDVSRQQEAGDGNCLRTLVQAMFAASMPSCAAGAELSEEVKATLGQNAVRKMQQALSDQGHYRGRVDGVMGLRTRASIRAFQRTENLPATGQIDPQTAHKLGITQDCVLATRTAHDGRKLSHGLAQE